MLPQPDAALQRLVDKRLYEPITELLPRATVGRGGADIMMRERATERVCAAATCSASWRGATDRATDLSKAALEPPIDLGEPVQVRSALRCAPWLRRPSPMWHTLGC